MSRENKRKLFLWELTYDTILSYSDNNIFQPPKKDINKDDIEFQNSTIMTEFSLLISHQSIVDEK